jgi:hypothetical protein
VPDGDGEEMRRAAAAGTVRRLYRAGRDGASGSETAGKEAAQAGQVG